MHMVCVLQDLKASSMSVDPKKGYNMTTSCFQVEALDLANDFTYIGVWRTGVLIQGLMSQSLVCDAI